METTPRLSVTVLNYNYGHYLGKCLRSILSQSMSDFELILINDCSTDNSRDIIAPFLSDPRIRFIDHETNQGYVFSLLEGCRLSRGGVLTVISADDYALDSHAFARACQTLETDPAISLCYSAWHEVNDRDEVRHTRRAAEQDYVLAGPDEFRRLMLSSPILHSGAMIPRWAYDAVGGYDPECRYSVDTNMWLALCAAGKVAYLNTPLYAYRAHNSNLSQSAGSLWRATEEMLFGIDKALARFPSGAILNAAASAAAGVGGCADPGYLCRTPVARVAGLRHGAPALSIPDAASGADLDPASADAAGRTGLSVPLGSPSAQH